MRDPHVEGAFCNRPVRDAVQGVPVAAGLAAQPGLAGDVSIAQNRAVAQQPSICGSFRCHAELAAAVRLIDKGCVDLRPMVTASFPLTQARVAFDPASDRSQAMKVQLNFGVDTGAA